MKESFQNFTVLISAINRNIKKIKKEEMNEFDLKGPHVSCIYYLHKNGALTPKELCEICQEDKAMISRSLETLSSKGFLAKNMSDKKYKKSISLSQKGLQVAKKVAEKIDHIIKIVTTHLNEQLRFSMYEGLALINTNLEKICKKYGEKNGN